VVALDNGVYMCMLYESENSLIQNKTQTFSFCSSMVFNFQGSYRVRLTIRAHG